MEPDQLAGFRALRGIAVDEEILVKPKETPALELWPRCTARPLEGANGEPFGALMTFRDIAEKRRREWGFHQARVHLLEAIEALNAEFVMCDARNRITLCNSNDKEMHQEIARDIESGASDRELLEGFCDRGGHVASGLTRDAWLSE